MLLGGASCRPCAGQASRGHCSCNKCDAEDVTGDKMERRRGSGLCGIPGASCASGIGTEVERGEEENSGGKDIPGKGNNMYKGLSKRKQGESESERGSCGCEERSQGVPGADEAPELGSSRADRTMEAMVERILPSSIEPGKPTIGSSR